MENKILWDEMSIPTPSFVVEENLLRKNLEILKRVREESDAKILLAQKAFSMFHFYPLIREYLDGTTASGIYEAKLGAEEFGKQTHVFSPAYFKFPFSSMYSRSVFKGIPSCMHSRIVSRVISCSGR